MISDKVYYRSVRQVINAVNSDLSTKEKLNVIVRSVARSMKSASSVVLLNKTRQNLLHVASWGLPQYYLKKGLLDTRRSLSEVFSGEIVKITDVVNDPLVQFPDMAARAGIISILGIPIRIQEVIVGSLRIYRKDESNFSNRDESYINTMAHLVSLSIGEDLKCVPKKDDSQAGEIEQSREKLFKQVRPSAFAHPSEKQFADLLDFYDIEWVYEPRSFPLAWQQDKATEMFTPDFYLPGLELYIELTTLKQSLITGKNRKLRLLKELYPDIKIMLLNKNDYDRLLVKYGVGPLSQSKCQGIGRVLYSTDDIEQKVSSIAKQLSEDYSEHRPILVGAQRGFICFMADLIRKITVPLDLDFIGVSYYSGVDRSAIKIVKDLDLDIKDRHVVMIEDIVDTGITLNYILNHLRSRRPASLSVCTLLDKRARRLVDIELDYVGFEIPDEFVVGYGLDFREEYRNLPFIAIVDTGRAETYKKSKKQ